MATALYGNGLKLMLTDGLDNMFPELMLTGTNGTTYVYDQDHTVVDNAANDNTDPSFCETNATNNARKTAVDTVTHDTANDRVELAITDVTWTALGGAQNDTIDAAILYDDSANDNVDTTSYLLVYFDNADVTTNGGDVTLDFDTAEGNVRFPV